MPPEPIDPALTIFAVGTMLLSIVACMNVIHMRRRGPVLPYEARRPVPWGPVGCVLAVVYLLFTALSAFGGDGESPSQPAAPSALIVGMLQQLLIVGGPLFVIVVFTKATRRDIGLPTSVGQGIRDVCIGAAACLTALAPVLLIQQALMHLFFPEQTESGHPLIKMLMEAPPDRWTLFLAGVFAVVVAPVCEEIVFRLLLQGWLESWEDERLGWRRRAATDNPNELAATSTSAGLPGAETLPCAASDSYVESEPPRRGVGNMRYGWFPITVSSAAFGLAHFGYGPEPIPLFLLALVLGFLYQRTHRIIPSIVAHGLFNMFSMIILWRTVYHG
jgi:membrane protease YdiL (CAAX protease family)